MLHKMKNEVLLSILGTQEIDGEKERVEVKTCGRYSERDGKIFIEYKEYDEDDPTRVSSNLVKIDGDRRVTIIQGGKSGSRLTLENGRRHQCHYRTPAGPMWIGVFTENIKSSFKSGEGAVQVKYTLDFNSDLVSNNEIKITVKKN